MDLMAAAATSGPVDTWTAFAALTLAFTLSQLVAAVYMWTFQSMSYNRSIVAGMALGSLVTAMLMLAIGDSLAAGVGLAGGLSIIRFRTTMRDPRDMVFVFACLAVGVVCGLQAYPVAIVGTTVFCTAAVLMHLTEFGSRQAFDGLLRFAAPSESADAIAQTMAAHCHRFTLVTLREAEQGGLVEQAFQVQVPDPSKRIELVHRLEGLAGVRDVALHMQNPALEL